MRWDAMEDAMDAMEDAILRSIDRNLVNGKYDVWLG